MDKKYVCPCGLICYDCLFYKSEIYETAIKLKQLIQESQLDVFLSILSKNEVNKAIANHLNADENEFGAYFESFRKLPDFFQVLDGIINIQCKRTCQESGGCSMTGSLKKCEAVQCVKQKGYNGCWECKENESCNKLIFQRKSYGETIDDNFKIIKEKSIQAVESRGNKYYSWQRKNDVSKNRNDIDQ